MEMIDLTTGDRTYVVPTKVIREGIGYMGPDVQVTARNPDHAKQVAEKAGHLHNEHFPVKEVRDQVRRW